MARDWRARALARADGPPLVPRVPLWAGASRIGSVEPDVMRPVRVAGWHETPHGFVVEGEVTDTLARLAFALRNAGIAHAWRDEQLAVRDEAGHLLGTVERAVVRPLGIATSAVHLAAVAPDGRHWVQQRSLTKPNDPGLWDTLMGGMVPASDSLEEALARETWEEAGLHMRQLADVRHGGRVVTRRPTNSGRGGYMIECIDWYTAVVPPGLEPCNQDGEVARFALLAPAELEQRLGRDQFTLEATLVLAACLAQARH